jgi:hypothetical protein
LNGFGKGIAGAVENGRGLNIACFSGFGDEGGQLGELGWLVAGLHNEGLDLCGRAATEHLPQLVAEWSVWESAIGHAQAELQPLMAEIKGSACAIQLPPPSPTTLFKAAGVASNHDHSRAANQHDSGIVGEGSTQGGAFVASGDAVLNR